MKSHSKMYLLLKAIFSVFMFFSALGELTLHETVVSSMHQIGMPVYLLGLLGTLKLLGIIVLWLPGAIRLKEWAYAGFTFDFAGAIYGFVATGEYVLPDVIMAPVALALCLGAYLYFRQSRRKIPVEEGRILAATVST